MKKKLLPVFFFLFITFVSAQNSGYYFLSKYKPFGLGNSPQQMILDSTGSMVFFRSLKTLDFKLQPNGLMSYYRSGKYYLMDSTFRNVDTVVCKNGITTDDHDFQVLPNGHFLIMGTHTDTMDLSGYHMFLHNGTQGSAVARVLSWVIQEQDTDKNVVFQWNAKDYFAFDDIDEFFLNDSLNVNWIHSNSLELDTDGNILMSSRHFNEITKINRTDSSIMWHFGGKHNEFTFLSDTTPFLGQHDCRRIDNGHITLFDNGNGIMPHGARALEYELDETSKTADLKWSYIFDSSVYSPAMGNAQRISDGSTVVSYGIQSPSNTVSFTRVDSLGTKIFEYLLYDTSETYRAFYYPELPFQLQRPQITCFDSAGVHYLDAGPGYTSYHWSSGTNMRLYHATVADTFSVYVNFGLGFIYSEKFIVSDTADPCGMFTSVEQKILRENSLLVSPVPFTNSFMIDIPEKINGEGILTMADVTGREVLSKIIFGEKKVFVDASAFAKGIYLIHFSSGGKTYHAKAVKE